MQSFFTDINNKRSDNTRNSLRVLLMLTFMTVCLFLTSCGMQTNGKSMKQVGFYFDTVVTFTAYYKDFTSSDSSFFSRYSDAEKNCSEFLDECQKACARYDHLFSTTKEGGDIWNINHSQGSPVEVDVDTYRLLQKALYYAEVSDGAFDPTIGTVTDLWNFHADTDKAVPDEVSLQNALSHVDYKKVILTEKKQKYYVQLLDKDSRIDLGGIAKGYIADKLKDLYLSRGAKSGIINLGGNVLLIGSKPAESGSSSSYTTGVQRPFGDSGDPIVRLSLEDRSVVTSGIYDRFFEKDGRIYHHILNAKTGMPVENDLYSATIVSKSSVDGDALSTISYMLGTETGMELINSIPDTYVLYVTDKYEIVSSEDFPGLK